MKVQNIVNILKAEILAEGDLQEEVKTACGSDMMSDVLAYGQRVKTAGLNLLSAPGNDLVAAPAPAAAAAP